MPQSTMPQISNVVMLMLENRSLDNPFGSLYTGGAPLRSAGRDANVSLRAIEQFDLPTIFNALTQAGKACGPYFDCFPSCLDLLAAYVAFFFAAAFGLSPSA